MYNVKSKVQEKLFKIQGIPLHKQSLILQIFIKYPCLFVLLIQVSNRLYYRNIIANFEWLDFAPTFLYNYRFTFQ